VESFDRRLEEVRANEQVLGFLLVVHGLVHLIGFVLAWRILVPAGFAYDDVWPDAGTWPGRAVGVVWLLIAVSLGLVGIRLANRRDVPVGALVVPLLASVVVSALSTPQALPGLVVSATLLGAIVILRHRREAAVAAAK
jgi:hydrogenase/urease accessory protein HupE